MILVRGTLIILGTRSEPPTQVGLGPRTFRIFLVITDHPRKSDSSGLESEHKKVLTSSVSTPACVVYPSILGYYGQYLIDYWVKIGFPIIVHVQGGHQMPN